MKKLSNFLKITQLPINRASPASGWSSPRVQEFKETEGEQTQKETKNHKLLVCNLRLCPQCTLVKWRGWMKSLLSPRFCFLFIIWWTAPSSPSHFFALNVPFKRHEQTVRCKFCKPEFHPSCIPSTSMGWWRCPYHLLIPGMGSLPSLADGYRWLGSWLGVFRVPTCFFLVRSPSIILLYFTFECPQMLWVLRPLD